LLFLWAYLIGKIIRDTLYLYTRSIVKQEGSDNLGQLSQLKFKTVLSNLVDLPFNLQKEKFSNFMQEWTANKIQTENVKFIAIKIE